MSIPLYWSDEGLPIGTHFIGRFGDEATLFRLAAQLEEARPWKHRRPPVSTGIDKIKPKNGIRRYQKDAQFQQDKSLAFSDTHNMMNGR